MVLVNYAAMYVQVPDDGGGAIFKEVNLAHMVEGAVPIAQQLCERVHKSERCAEVVVEGDVAATLTCAPSHVSHILMEMLKNALNATAERKKKENASCECKSRACMSLVLRR